MKKIISFIFVFVISLFMVTEVKASGFFVEDFSVKDKSETMIVEDVTFNENTISSNIKFNKKDDYAVFEFNIKNDEDKDYKIDSISDNNENDHIDIEYDYSKDTIKSNNSTKVTVTMKYSDKLLNVDKETIEDLKLSIKLIEVKSNNPDTFDNILRYVVVFIVSSIVLIVLVKRYKKVSLIIIVSLLFIPFITYALDEILIEITFNNIEVTGEYETYNINVNEDNGNSYTIDVTYGQTVGTLEAPVKEGYNFVNWTDEDGNTVTENTEVTKPIAITANYEPIKYTITYNLNGGSATNEVEYTVEDEVVITNPTKEYYEFVGWSGSNGNTPEKDLVIAKGTTGDKTYTANYEGTKYIITYNLNGGSATNDVEYTIEDEVTIADPTKDAYTFVGWTGSNGEVPTKDLVIPVGSYGDKNYVAHYEATTYTITYNLDGGNANNDTEYTVEDTITITNPTKAHHTFIGWTGSNGTTPEKDLVVPVGTYGDLTYTANYEIYTYTIEFNGNGGNGSMSSVTLDYDEEYTLPNNTFNYPDYEFVGWEDEDGNKYQNKEVVKELVEENNGTIVLYARWEKIREITLTVGYGMTDITYGDASDDTEILVYLIKGQEIDLSSITANYTGDFSGTKFYVKNTDGTLTEITTSKYTVGDSDAEILVDPAYPKKCYCNNFTTTTGTECSIGVFTYKYKYKASSSGWTTQTMTENGWGIKITDKNSTAPVTEAACAYINDKPLVNTMHAFSSSKATTIDMSGWYTKNIVQMTYMFNKAEATAITGLSNLDVTSVSNMGGVFYYMPNITEIDITGWDTRNATNFNVMFQKATSLQKIYVGPNFDTSNNNQTQTNKMFLGCTSLVGGAGTVYDANNVGTSYAVIDDPDNGHPGYFTEGPAPTTP